MTTSRETGPGPLGSGSRRLLRRLRDIMAAGGGARERLDQIVRIVAADMVAEVCSVYLRRAGDVLELFATQGLKPEAVHVTRLRIGEGLVGDIAAHARPLALADAQSHPAFAYRPETGEEIYRSLVGVPVLREGRVQGVLVVQNRTSRQYGEDEIESLEIIATMLAELIASGGLVSPDELRQVEGIGMLPQKLDGIRINGGVAMGLAVLHRPQFRIDRFVAENIDEETTRLDEALSHVRQTIDDLLSNPLPTAGESEESEILDTFRMFADDQGWVSRMQEAVHSGLTAEAAVQKVLNDTRARMAQVSDPYIRERLADLEDLGNRLLYLLTGTDPLAHRDLPDDIILVARAMGPAEILDYDRARLRGLILEEGSHTAHVSVIARALDIPVLGHVRDALARIEALDPVIIDADHSQAFLRPPEDIQEAYEALAQQSLEKGRLYLAMRDLPAVSVDGVTVSIDLNANLLPDVEALATCGADGIGLFRTEIHFMAFDRYPEVENQVELYQRILDLADGKPVRFRTLDVGGDKGLPYWRGIDEENPSMGWRSIRIALDRPQLLRQQVRAFLIAAAGRPIDIMLPMVTEVSEFTRAKAIIDQEIERVSAKGIALPARLRIGVMFEVPALFWQLPTLLPKIDFLSVGTNDLFQFLFASDRGNPRLTARYDVLSPVALRFLRALIHACDEGGVPVAVCGEMAGQPLEALALVGLGYRRLSMNAVGVGPVKAMIRGMAVGDVAAYLDEILDLPDHSLRERLRAFARDHKIPV